MAAVPKFRVGMTLQIRSTPKDPGGIGKCTKVNWSEDADKSTKEGVRVLIPNNPKQQAAKAKKEAKGEEFHGFWYDCALVEIG